MAKIRHFQIDSGLISAFVERWQSETHTLHSTCGEATITLEDVTLLLGLPINGNEVIEQTSGLRITFCEELLSVVSSPE